VLEFSRVNLLSPASLNALIMDFGCVCLCFCVAIETHKPMSNYDSLKGDKLSQPMRQLNAS